MIPQYEKPKKKKQTNKKTKLYDDVACYSTSY